MAITNQERVGKAVDLLRAGLAPYVEREFANVYKDKTLAEARRSLPAEDRINGNRAIAHRCATDRAAVRASPGATCGDRDRPTAGFDRTSWHVAYRRAHDRDCRASGSPAGADPDRPDQTSRPARVRRSRDNRLSSILPTAPVGVDYADRMSAARLSRGAAQTCAGHQVVTHNGLSVIPICSHKIRCHPRACPEDPCRHGP